MPCTTSLNLTRATPGSAGYELTTLEDIRITPGNRYIVPTGVSITSMPKNKMCIIRPKSGHACNYGIQILAGLIDSDYRGEIKVILYNSGDKEFFVEAGKSVAQLTLEKYYTFDEENIKDNTDLHLGFGSTNC